MRQLHSARLERYIVTIGLTMLVAQADASVQLITLPIRERVELQLDHPGVTLVEEERFVPLTRGVNEVVFGWSTATVDPGSVRLRCLSTPDEVQVLSVSYPPGQNALTWQLSSPRALSERVRISYIVSGLSKSYSYRAVASHEETVLTLREYIDLHNRANEAFGVAGMWPGFGEPLERPIGIDETKRLLAQKYVNVPIHKTYTADLEAYGYLDAPKSQLLVPMHYVIENGKADGMGRFPLPPGKVRIFQDDGRGTEVFLGEDWGAFTPRDDEMKLYLGVAKDVIVKRTIARREKQRVLGNLYNYDVVVKYEIENFKDRAVTLDLAESMPFLRREILGDTGRVVDWTLEKDGTLAPLYDKDKSTSDKVLFHVPLPARGPDQAATKQVQTLHVVMKNEW